jgi:long-chain acyl-CoA synthetase
VLDPSPTNLVQLVHDHALRRPTDEAIVQPGTARRALTWAELDRTVDAVAAGFADQGLVAGHRVGLSGPNSIEYVIGYLAVLRAGLVAVPIDPRRETAAVRELIEQCGIKSTLTGAGLEELARHGHSPVISPPDPESLALLLPTSGTTARPRLVMLSHRALLAQASWTGLIEQQHTVLGALPYVHVFGLSAVLGGWLGAGARLVVADGFSSDLPQIIANEAVDDLPLTPSLLFALLRGGQHADQLRAVRRVLCAGAPLPGQLSAEFTERTGLRIDHGYGLTEAAGVAATFGGPVLGPSHVGQPLPGVEVRIANSRDPSEPGLIAIRGANLFSGYWPDGSGGPDASGWYLTDDIGYLRDAALFLVDRARDVILVSGFPVYPREIEQVIRQLSPVSAVAVLGSQHPKAGSRLVAFVSGFGLSEEQVADHCRANLPGYKRPIEIRLLDELPRSLTGEVDRSQLRQLLPTGGGL